MPAEIVQTVMQDGSKLTTFLITIESDGTELVNQPIWNSRNHTIPNQPYKEFTLNRIWWGQSYFDSILKADDTVPVKLWVMPVGTDSHIDFRSAGGIKVPTDLDGTGILTLSTFGFAPAGSVGSYLIEIKKS